jgi:hypothetical protein
MNINRALDLAIGALDVKRSHAADNLRRCKMQIERSPDMETTLRYQGYAAEYEADLWEIEEAIAALRAAQSQPAPAERPADGDGSVRARGGA